MQIILNPIEKRVLRSIADRYRKETGDNYSIFVIQSMLADKYEENLAEDLEQIIAQKIDIAAEKQAEDGKFLSQFTKSKTKTIKNKNT